MIDSAHKICNECGQKKPLKSFPMGRVRNDRTRSRKPKCYKCSESRYIESKRRRQRELARTEKRKQQVREAHERYRQTDKFKEYLKQYQSMIQQRRDLIRRWEERREQVRRIDFLPLIPIDRVWNDIRKFIDKRNNPNCTCKECGTKYHWTMYWMNTSACSVECKEKRLKKARRKARLKQKKDPNFKRLKNHRERARYYGVKYERVNIESIFIRDNYQCKGCGINVVRSKRYKPNQATIDHMVPLSRGGSHTRENLITLCHQCNSDKNDKTWSEWGSAPLNVKKVLKE